MSRLKTKKKTNKQKIQPNPTHQSTKKFSLVNFVKLISVGTGYFLMQSKLISYAEVVDVKAKKKKNQPNIKNKKKKKKKKI